MTDRQRPSNDQNDQNKHELEQFLEAIIVNAQHICCY